MTALIASPEKRKTTAAPMSSPTSAFGETIWVSTKRWKSSPGATPMLTVASTQASV